MNEISMLTFCFIIEVSTIWHVHIVLQHDSHLRMVLLTRCERRFSSHKWIFESRNRSQERMERWFIFVNESRSKYILKGQKRDEKTHPKSKLQNKRMSAMWPELTCLMTIGWLFLEYIQLHSAGLQQFHNMNTISALPWWIRFESFGIYFKNDNCNWFIHINMFFLIVSYRSAVSEETFRANQNRYTGMAQLR